MRKVRIVRVGEADQATFGVLFIDSKPLFVTLEEPWRDNQREVSCIPEGTYKLEWVHSPTFGKTLEVADVPGRKHILFHRGNTPDDTKGCILVGFQYGELRDRSAILNSRPAVEKFLGLLKDAPDIDLEIISIGRVH